MGRIEHIHLAAAAGAPMRSVEEALVLRGIGPVGDRYAAGEGHWRDAKASRDVTLVESEVLEQAGLALEPGETRRTVTTRGIELNALVGRTFWIGDLLCLGTGLCEPCRHLEEVTGKPLVQPLVHRGGLRAKVLNTAAIRVGDPVVAVEEQAGVGVVVLRGSRVLLGRRLSRHGYGTWSFPGGKPLPGESAHECALRELSEEAGIEAGGAELVALTVDGFPESRTVFRTTFVRVDVDEAEPVAREPDRTASWHWFDWRELPRPLFAPVASLAATGYEPRTGPP